MANITYQCFWPGFTSSKDFIPIFEYIFSDVTSKVTIISLFGNIDPPSDGIIVSYSGEPFFKYFGPKCLYLTMAPEATIPIHLFSIHAYERNSWPILKGVRPQIVKDKFCAFVVGNGRPQTRIRFMEKLSKYSRVDSCGGFNNNIGVKAPSEFNEYMAFLSNYRFNICFENTNQKNYITEKLFFAWMGGGIPIYWGTPQVLEWFNPAAFLYLADDTEEAMEELVYKIKILNEDPEWYSMMQAQPLLLGDIPECMNRDTWKKKINKFLEDSNQK